MASTQENILFNAEAQADLADLQRVVDSLEQLGRSLDDVARDQRETAASAEQAEKAQKELAEGAKELSRAWGAIKAIGIGAIFSEIVSLAAQGVGQVQDWAMEVDQLANRLSISHEEATALATSWRLSGVEAESAFSQIESFQGRLIDELEAQKEAAKEVAKIQRERADLAADFADAESEHMGRLSALAAEQEEIRGQSIEAIPKKQARQLEELERDYNRFLEDQGQAEKEETAKLEEVWRDRARAHQRSFEDLRDELSDNARRARNFKEFQEARAEFEKKKRRLTEDINAEKSDLQGQSEQRVQQSRQAAEREKEIYEERKAAILESAADETAKFAENQANQLERVQSRIDRENNAWEKQGEQFNERMSSLAEAQAEASEKGAGLTFVMEELGVKIFDSEGKIRPVDELLWDMKAALEAMPDGARKAAIISDLGWEDLATWINDGANATESLQFAQENGLTVSEKTIEDIKEQNRQLAEMQLKLIGAGSTLAENLEIFEGFNTVLGYINEALTTLSELVTILTTEGGFDALLEGFKETGGALEIIADAIERIKDAVGIASDLNDQYGQISEAITENDASTGAVFSAVGQAVGSEFANRSTAESVANFALGATPLGGLKALGIIDSYPGLGGSGSPVNVNVNGNVYGVDDLESTISRAMQRSDQQAVPTGTR